MDRRNLITAAAALSVPAPAATTKNAIYELRYFHMRNGAQIQRTSDFLSKYFMPAANRAGIGPLGFFNQLIAEQGPFLLALTSYPSMAAMEAAMRGAHVTVLEKSDVRPPSSAPLAMRRLFS